MLGVPLSGTEGSTTGRTSVGGGPGAYINSNPYRRFLLYLSFLFFFSMYVCFENEGFVDNVWSESYVK